MYCTLHTHTHTHTHTCTVTRFKMEDDKKEIKKVRQQTDARRVQNEVLRMNVAEKSRKMREKDKDVELIDTKPLLPPNSRQ